MENVISLLFGRRSVNDIENVNHKDDKSMIKHESRIPRYHEYVEKEEAKKVSLNLYAKVMSDDVLLYPFTQIVVDPGGGPRSPPPPPHTHNPTTPPQPLPLLKLVKKDGCCFKSNWAPRTNFWIHFRYRNILMFILQNLYKSNFS